MPNKPTTPFTLRPLPLEQNKVGEAVHAFPHLPAMEKPEAVTTVIRDPLLHLMGSGAPVYTAGLGLMAPVPPTPHPPQPPSKDPQKPREVPRLPTASDGYLRVDVHFENGLLSIIGMKEVLGPLAVPSAVTRGYAYEVLLDDQQIALGSLPDVGLRRAFANRDVQG